MIQFIIRLIQGFLKPGFCYFSRIKCRCNDFRINFLEQNCS